MTNFAVLSVKHGGVMSAAATRSSIIHQFLCMMFACFVFVSLVCAEEIRIPSFFLTFTGNGNGAIAGPSVIIYRDMKYAYPGGNTLCSYRGSTSVDPTTLTIKMGWPRCDVSGCKSVYYTYTVEPSRAYCTSDTLVCNSSNGPAWCRDCNDIGVVQGGTIIPGIPKFELCDEVAFTDHSQSSGIANQNIRTTGVQWIDYNGDKRLDLFLVGTNGTALFKNVGSGKFVNVTSQARIGNDGKEARGASWADIDNDGDLDVFIANVTGPPTLLLNNHGVFSDISNLLRNPIGVADAGTTQAGVWVDINNDKDIDLFIVKDGGPNQLFKKTGFQFTNVASSAGVAATSTGRSATAADFNMDGFQDLFVVNFGQANRLYLNNGNETFKDLTANAGLGFAGGSVQAAVADYDRDKKLDIFVVNNTGSSILYRNLGNNKFKSTTPAILKTPVKGIAAAFADIDGDGNQDLILAQTIGGNFLFKNAGKGQFTLVTGVDLNNPDNPTGVTIGDYNNDGLPDIAIGDGDDSIDRGDSVYQNTGGGGNHFLQLTLVGSSANRSAIGARVVVQTGLTFQAKEVTSGNGQSQEGLTMNFGLGIAQLVDTLQIYWPGGSVQTLQNIKANTKLTVVQSK